MESYNENFDYFSCTKHGKMPLEINNYYTKLLFYVKRKIYYTNIKFCL